VSLGQEVDVLKRQMLSLRRQVQQHDEWIDTMSSSVFRRAWWVFQGYRWHRIGRWRGGD
jgi:hypothetical protein